jgi:type IV secretion system T-DNA border endonuclease VirD2
MSPNAQGVPVQAIVRVIPGGGTTNAAQIVNQWNYISRKGDVALERSDRYLDAAPVRPDDIPQLSEDWENHAAVYPGIVRADGTRRDITTHIVASLPHDANNDLENAKATLRAFAFEMFGSGRNGGQWDYFTAFHTDKDHPHLHIVLNRMSHEGRWLKISRRHPFMNYDNIRAVMADVAERHGFNLDSTTRAERGIIERPMTFAEYRRRIRDRVAIHPQPESDTPLPGELILRANPGTMESATKAAQQAAEAVLARLRLRETAAAAAARARLREEAALRDMVYGDPMDVDIEDVTDPDDVRGDRQRHLRARRRRREAENRRNNGARAQRERRIAQEAALERVDAERQTTRPRPAADATPQNGKRPRRWEKELAGLRNSGAVIRGLDNRDAEAGPSSGTRARRAAGRKKEQAQLRSGRIIEREELAADASSARKRKRAEEAEAANKRARTTAQEDAADAQERSPSTGAGSAHGTNSGGSRNDSRPGRGSREH